MSLLRYTLPTQHVIADLLPKIDLFLSRLEANPNVLKSGRIGAYRSYLAQPIESFDSPEHHAFILKEVFELTWILDGFAKNQPVGAHEAIQSLVSGAEFSVNDKNPNARNLQFELRIASYFCRSGFHVDLTKDADLVASRDGKQYFVECKRITSKNQFSKNIKKAGDQVLNSLKLGTKNGDQAFGVIAVDITGLIGDEDKLWFGWTSFHQRRQIQKRLKKFEKKISSDLRPEAKEKCILMWKQAVVCGYLRFPRMATTRFSSLFEIEGGKSQAYEGRQLFESLKVSFEQANRPQLTDGGNFHESIIIPAGAEFYFRSNLIEYFEANLKLPNLHPEEVILTVSFEGGEHHFRFYELEFAVSQFVENDWIKCREGSNGIMYSFLGSLWYWRTRLQNL